MSYRPKNSSSRGTSHEGLDMPEFCVPLNGGTLALTDMAQAETLAGGALAGHITLVDLAGMDQVKLTARVLTFSASVNSPRVGLKYRAGSIPGALGDLTQLGASAPVEFSLFTGGALLMETGWISIASAAKVNNVWLAMYTVGGDGAADPSLNCPMAWFR